MNKNLKRVISAVSALAVTASGAAAFAISYPDVPETADYNQAITELSALGVINGFDDGTFRPDENVTRAQITKMVVTALGNTAVSQAEASTGRDTQFQDVPASHWASGFVAVGTSSTASNFINGYSATTFGPEDNVTYAQAVKMVVAALGYTTLAEGQGGWPSGYLKYGYQLGIATLNGVGNDDQLNRAQVSVIIDNALKCPICVANGYTYDALGRQIPNTLIKDGTGDLDDTKDGYQNLLNYAHDAYLVYGRVTGTFKTDDTDADKVRFRVEKSDNWDGNDNKAINAKNDGADEIQAYKGQVSDADKYLFTYSQAIIQKDRNDDYVLLSIVPYGSVDIVELAASDYRDFKTGTKTDEYQLQMYKDAGHSKYDTYKLDFTELGQKNAEHGTGIYVNGKEYGDAYDDLYAFFNGKYVDQNKVGKVTLIDATDLAKSSTDGKYDYVMITYYLDGVVSDVDYRSDKATINLDDAADEMKGKIVLDYDDDDTDYSITLNGEVISAEDLKEGDVLSVAYDVTGTFGASKTYDIYVSRDTVEGKITSIYEDKDDDLDSEYTVDNGEIYKLAYSNAATLKNGSSYTLYLDAFGKVAKADELASSKKYAVVENVYKTNGGADSYVDIITGTGDKVSYSVDDDDYADFANVLFGTTGTGYQAYINEDDKLDHRTEMWNRVIAYKVSTKGELRFNDNDKKVAESGSKITEAEYKSATAKLGTYQLSEASSSIIDINDYYEDLQDTSKAQKSQSYSSLSLSDFVAGTKYDGYAFGRSEGSDRYYQYVLITKGVGGFNVENPWAIFVQSTTIDSDSGNGDAATVYQNGELRTIPADADMSDYSAGDVFFYKLTTDNEIDTKTVKKVASIDSTNYRTFIRNAIDDEFDLINATTANEFTNTFSKPSNISKERNKLISGAIVDVSNGTVKLATKAEINMEGQSINKFALDNVTSDGEFDLASEAKVYVYDFAVSKAKDRIETSGKGAVRKSAFSGAGYYTNSAEDITKKDDIINFNGQYEEDTNPETVHNNNYGSINVAIAKVVDNEITEILVVIPDDDDK